MALGPDRLRAAVTLAVYGLLLVVTGQLALVVAPLPVAVAVARGRNRFALALFAAIVAAGMASVIGVMGLLVSGILGAAAGWGIRRRMPYTALVTGVAFLALALNAMSLAVRWDATVEEVDASYEALDLQLKNAADKGLSEQAIANLTVRQWLLGHWQDVYLGITFAGMLVLSCIVVSATVKWLTLRAHTQAARTFTTFQTPDWLVWCLIAVAAFWYLDYTTEVSSMRFVSWNAGFALIGAYWLNGLAILMHAVAAMRPNALILAVLVAGMVFFGLAPMLAFVGLFDTWGDFRPRIDRLLAARQEAEDADDDNAH